MISIRRSIDILDPQEDFISIPSPTGDGYQDILSMRFDEKTGIPEVYVSGKKCLQDEIDAALEDTLISTILRKATNGQLDVLNKRIGTYANITNLGSNIFEVAAKASELRKFYLAQPEEIRKKFPSFEAYCEAAGSELFTSTYSDFINRETAAAAAVSAQEVSDNA